MLIEPPFDMILAFELLVAFEFLVTFEFLVAFAIFCFVIFYLLWVFLSKSIITFYAADSPRSFSKESLEIAK
jgi:hypothetical protein